MESFAIAAASSIVLLFVSVAIFYEILAHTWIRLPRLEQRPRAQILLTVFATMLAHILVITLFGSAMYALAHHTDIGLLRGGDADDLMSYIYFSAVSYSSLGIENTTPTGDLQMIVGVEAILGLILIGWTVAFTYIVTEKYLFLRRDPKA